MRPVWASTGEQLLTELDVLHAQIASLQTRRLHVMAAIDNLGHAKEIGATDTVRLLAFRHRLDATTVRHDLKLAKALPTYELVSAALPDPSTPDHDHDRDPDSMNADACNADRDDQSAEHGAHPAANAGPVVLHPAQADAIVSALEQIPARANVAAQDLRVAEAQMVEAARHLSPKDLRLLSTTVRDRLDADGPEPAEDKAAAKEALWLKSASKGVRFGGFLANENAELLQTLIEAGASPKKTPDGHRDPRPRTKRQADALVNILNAAAESGNAAPAHGGIKPCLMITIDLDALKTAGAQATGDLQFGEGLSAAAVRRLACDANVIPIVLGATSEPLDIGRAKRFVTDTIRQALIARDRGCVTCGAPPDQCDAHHLESWIDGGPTSLNNLVLQCKPDHRAAHRGEFIIKIIDGIVHVSRPTWAETGPTPTRTHNPSQQGNPTPNTAPDTDRPAEPGETADSPGPTEPTSSAESTETAESTGSAESARTAESAGSAGSPGSAASPGAIRSAGAAGSPGVAESTGSAEAAGSAGSAGSPGSAGLAGLAGLAGSPGGGDSSGSAGSLGSPRVWGDPPEPGEDHGERLDGRSPEDARAWPWTSDPNPLTREAAIQLAPWGDNEEDNLPPARREPTPPPTWVSPWGDDQDQPQSAHSDNKVAPAQATPCDKREDGTSAPGDGEDPQIQQAS